MSLGVDTLVTVLDTTKMRDLNIRSLGVDTVCAVLDMMTLKLSGSSGGGVQEVVGSSIVLAANHPHPTGNEGGGGGGQCSVSGKRKQNNENKNEVHCSSNAHIEEHTKVAM